MFRILAVFAALSIYLLADSSYYTVRLGVYQNHQSLKEMTSKFTPALRNTVMFYQKDSVTVACTLPTPNKNTLIRLLPAYRKVFKDAYIRGVKPGELPVQKKKNLKKIYL